MAVNQDGGVQNYLNTLIFCIVAKAITIILLALLFTDLGASLAYMILTIEIGLVVIIFVALVQIQAYEKKKLKDVEASLTAKSAITSCPDYYIRGVTDENTILCTNTYETPDGAYKYEFATEPFSIDTVFKDMTNADACSRVTQSNSTPNFTQSAWTDLKERCFILRQ